MKTIVTIIALTLACLTVTAQESHYHTPDLYLFMAIAYERLGAYKEARQSYKDAVGAGHPSGAAAYKAFKKREKQRQKAK